MLLVVNEDAGFQPNPPKSKLPLDLVIFLGIQCTDDKNCTARELVKWMHLNCSSLLKASFDAQAWYQLILYHLVNDDRFFKTSNAEKVLFITVNDKLRSSEVIGFLFKYQRAYPKWGVHNKYIPSFFRFLYLHNNLHCLRSLLPGIDQM